MKRSSRGFTLVEVLVALMIIAMGLSALMVAVSGTARTSGYLRDKTLAQWIALNRLSELRLNVGKAVQTTDTGTGELKFANRSWHYDTRYFDTSVKSMKRVVVRVYAGDAKTKGNPLADSTSFIGTALAAPGTSNASDWTTGSTVATAAAAANANASGSGNGNGAGATPNGTTATPAPNGTTPTPAPNSAPQTTP